MSAGADLRDAQHDFDSIEGEHHALDDLAHPVVSNAGLEGIERDAQGRFGKADPASRCGIEVRQWGAASPVLS